MLNTKFHKPVLGTQIISRPRINKIFNGIPVSTLVCAPAGYGKSVAVSQWLDNHSVNYLWLNLDEDQNHLNIFLEYLVTGLQEIYPNKFYNFNSLISNHRLVNKDKLKEVFINELDEIEEPLYIILEDYHLITDIDIHSIVETCIKYSTRYLKFIIISRLDPPFNTFDLKVYEKLQEIRMKELALDHNEIVELIESNLDISISENELKNFEDHAEGWILGIKLAISLVRKNRSISLNSSLLMSHDISRIVKNLIENLDDNLPDFLLSFSLCKKFNEDLLRSIVKFSGNKWNFDANIIEVLKDQNLFITQLDEQGKWYRFHHFFREILLKISFENKPEETQSLYSHISEWFADNDMIDEGINYVIESNQYDKAIELIAKFRYDMLNNDRWWQVQRWIDKVPEKIRKTNPELLLAQTLIFENTWELDKIPPIINALEKLLDSELSEIQKSEILYNKGHQQLNVHSDPKGAIEFFNKSKNIYTDNTAFFARRELFLSISLQMSGEIEKALRSIAEMGKIYKTGTYLYLRTLFAKTIVLLLSGDFKKVKKTVEEFEYFSRDSGFDSIESYSCYLLANISLQMLNIEETIDLLDRGMKFIGKMNYRLYFDSMIMKALCYKIKGEDTLAKETVDNINKLVNQLQNKSFIVYYQSAKARLKWLNDSDNDLLSEIKELNFKTHFMEIYFFVDVPIITQCKILISSGQTEAMKEGYLRIKEIESYLLSINNGYHYLDISMLKVYYYYKNGKNKKASILAKSIINEANTRNTWWPILEYLIKEPALISILDKSILPSHLIELLPQEIDSFIDIESRISIKQNNDRQISYREQEVLKAVAMGLRNKEIAESLNISEVTVKSHLTNIFRKIDVPNRTSMIKRARELNLI
ncbi:LuxR C-terminal-related transcriptional regulator [Mangrovivirga sp. M17]|uniref:LuxR C-terminal-related transcriptional regulator n=1 Tax=Mangrovivirga halotolerans TaxID=2993936 RepID=A0ABT3RPX3_9BACT|nr:LuxR C-terminal-related transcriptional regulator [Mangrovivirga halotolerans]MCX2743843.1 LuxR C-terminal-related transcriptional regulator [Mangrovivirga halotolerans]